MSRLAFLVFSLRCPGRQMTEVDGARVRVGKEEVAGGTSSIVLRGGLLGELALALPPTLTIIGALFFVEALTRQRILFASLASSAFLIYREPQHHMNSMRVMIASHIIAVVAGTACGLVLGSGYVAAALAMTLTICILIVGNVVHPPAISTALGFAFYAGQYETVGVFLLALLMLTALVGMQRAAVWSLAKVQPRPGATPDRGRKRV